MAAASAKDARRKEEKNRAEIEEEQRRRENLFNLRYHQDMTDRTEVQGMLRELRERQDAQRSQDEARGAVMGDTKEQQIAQQNGRNKAQADSIAQIASNSSLLKDGYLDKYENSLSNYYQQRRNHNARMAEIEMNRSNQWATAAENGVKAMTGALGVVAGAADGGGGPAKAPAAPMTVDDGSVTTAGQIAAAPSRSAQFEIGKQAVSSPLEKVVLGDLAGVAKSTEPQPAPQPAPAPFVPDDEKMPWQIKVPGTWYNPN